MYVKFFYGRVLIASRDRASESFVDGDNIYTELKTKEVQAAKVFPQNILPVCYGVKFFSSAVRSTGSFAAAEGICRKLPMG
jgi:hypothetical protein